MAHLCVIGNNNFFVNNIFLVKINVIKMMIRLTNQWTVRKSLMLCIRIEKYFLIVTMYNLTFNKYTMFRVDHVRNKKFLFEIEEDDTS